MPTDRRLGSRLGLIAAGALVLASSASAQVTISTGRVGGVTAGPPGRISGLGVPSKAPRIWGTRRGSLLPADRPSTRPPASCPPPSHGGRPPHHPVYPPAWICTPRPGHDWWDGSSGRGYVSGSGFSASGSYSSGNFSLAFHLGGLGHHQYVCYPVYGKPIYYYPGYYRWYYGYYDYPGFYGLNVGSDARIDPAAVEAWERAQSNRQSAPAPARELTAIERAELALAQGRYDDAARWYEAYLKDAPDDAAAVRALAVALVGQGSTVQASAVMALAFETDPSLATRPMSMDDLGGASRARDLVIAAVRQAHRTGSSSDWLTVTVLMQAQEKAGNARRMLQRAVDAGLTVRVSGPLESALAR